MQIAASSAFQSLWLFKESTLPKNDSGHPVYVTVSLLKMNQIGAFIQYLRLTYFGLGQSEPLKLKIW